MTPMPAIDDEQVCHHPEVLFKGWLSPPDALSWWQETLNFWCIIQIGEMLDITYNMIYYYISSIIIIFTVRDIIISFPSFLAFFSNSAESPGIRPGSHSAPQKQHFPCRDRWGRSMGLCFDQHPRMKKLRKIQKIQSPKLPLRRCEKTSDEN